MSLGLILVIVLVVYLIGGFGYTRYYPGQPAPVWWYEPNPLVIILLIIVLLAVLRVI